VTPQEYRASLQPQVDTGMLSAETADMLTEDYAEMESEWQVARDILDKFDVSLGDIIFTIGLED